MSILLHIQGGWTSKCLALSSILLLELSASQRLTLKELQGLGFAHLISSS